MIARMNKVTVLCVDTDREGALRELAALGVLHLVPVVEPAREVTDAARALLGSAQDAQRAIHASVRGRRRTRDGAGTGPAASLPPDGEAVVAAVKTIRERLRASADERDRLEAEIGRVRAFGDFDPALAGSLSQAGLVVRLFEVEGRDLPPAPEGAYVLVVRGSPDRSAVVLIAPPGAAYPGREVPLPRRRLSEMDAELADLRAGIEGLERGLRELAAPEGLARVEDRILQLRHGAEVTEARAGMGLDGPVAYLAGFCPARRLDRLREMAGRHGWGLLIEEPAPEDRVPTLIENPRWLRPVESVFTAIRILPGYREVDVSAPFLFFLSLFFAMIVGDAGYGLVFLILTLLARRKWPAAPSGPFVLMTAFSLCTIVWGVLSGAYFGIDPLPAPLAALQARIPATRWLADRNNIMTLCLTIGSVHLSLAHGWNVVRMINTPQALAQLGWIGIVWTMFMLSRMLMFGVALPPWFAVNLAVSLLLIGLFMTPPRKLKAEWINHAMLPLSLMSAFGDVLSYLRLYALGVAGFKVAGAFNIMAGGIGYSNVLTGLVSALILFLAHGLNVALAGMSVLVHGIRLNALEFSMHLGLEWSGTEYRPFGGPAGDR